MNDTAIIESAATEAQEAAQAAELAAWLDQRCGKLTASRMKDAIDFKRDGSPSQKRSDYMRDLLAERLTQISTRHYVNPAMQWGLETEPMARLRYAEITGHKLVSGEFVEHVGIGNFGCTPDAFVRSKSDGRGLLEIKCPTTSTFVQWRLIKGIPPEHLPQLLAQLACCRDHGWVDFFAYDPRIKDDKMNYILRRYKPTQSDITSIELQATIFLGELDDMFDQFVSAI